jgi:dienelactone hydrolase
MNQHGNRYHAEADRDSWPKTLAFFGKYLRQAPVAAN